MNRARILLAAMLLAACSDDPSGPAGVPDASLTFVRQDPTAPPLVAARDSFWAKVGDGRDVRLFYQGSTPTDSGDEFLRFEVSGEALYRRPDGSAFQPGDSILITVTVVDPLRLHFEFGPSGLRFDPEHPARLRVRYGNCDKDFDDDGDLDERDDEIESQLGLWHRSSASALWVKVGTVQFEESDEIDANIGTFSQYAVAW